MTWAENCEIFKDCELAFKLTFFNKCEESEQALLEEYYQRCFGRELLNQELPKQELSGSMRNDE